MISCRAICPKTHVVRPVVIIDGKETRFYARLPRCCIGQPDRAGDRGRRRWWPCSSSWAGAGSLPVPPSYRRRQGRRAMTESRAAPLHRAHGRNWMSDPGAGACVVPGPGEHGGVPRRPGPARPDQGRRSRLRHPRRRPVLLPPWTTASWSGPRRSPWRTCPRGPARPGCGALEHERIPFVSYPGYEWTFSMLRRRPGPPGPAVGRPRRRPDHEGRLRLQPRVVGSRPTFIDVGSFERVRPGEPWAATGSSARRCSTRCCSRPTRTSASALAARCRPGHPAPGPGQAVLRHRQDEAGRARASRSTAPWTSATPSPEPRTPRRS